MASITFFFPFRKKECECVSTHTGTHFHGACKVTSTLNLGRVRWMLAKALECLHNRIVPLSWSGAWEQDKATNHQIRSCPRNCFWSDFFSFSLPNPLPFLSLTNAQVFATTRTDLEERRTTQFIQMWKELKEPGTLLKLDIKNLHK